MLVQVKHRGWVFIQGFYYKNRGRGRIVHTGEGREICKIRLRGKIKFKHTTTASTAEKYTKRSGSYNTRSKILKYIQLQTNDLKILYLN